jgi:hypothetical protein
MSRVAPITPEAFLSGIADKMGQESADVVSKTYGITPDMDQSHFITLAMRWAGDVIFDGT